MPARATHGQGALLSKRPDPELPISGCFTQVGLFVCFEGGDGSGKSTQSQLLCDWLDAERYDAVSTFEPGDTYAGRAIRQIVLDPATGVLADRTEFLLYLADKAEHVSAVVRPALDRGAVVVTDRYVDSTLAYQGAGRALEVDELEEIARWATEDLRPHLTVVLDLEPARGLGRFGQRDRIEGESLEFHDRARAAFVAIAQADPQHYLVLDAGLSEQTIAAAVRDRVTPMLDRAERRVR